MRALVFMLFLAGVPAHAVDCWTITNLRTGDVGIGSTDGRTNTLGRAITGRRSRLVYLINPATGKGETFRIFVGGTSTTKIAWAQFVAAEKKP
jgi:hypothetical protein